MRRMTFTPGVLLTVGALLLGCAGPGAPGGPAEIPDEVLLRSSDLGGAKISAGGPEAPHSLPPRPCAGTPGGPSSQAAPPSGPAGSGPAGSGPAGSGPAGSGPGRPEPLAERAINATMGQYRVYEHVGRYPAGLAGGAMAALRDELSRCGRPAEGEDWRVLTEDSAGLLLLRSYSGGDATDAYYVGVAGDYLVAVLVTGTRMRDGDPTTASGLGGTALTRAGGSRGTPVPPTTATGPATWGTFQAEVTGLRRGPNPRTLLADVAVPAGGPDCARNPRVGWSTEENGMIYASIVVDSAGTGQVGGCPTRAPGVVRLTSAKPVGDRIVVLNEQPWAPDGTGYRRCSADLGCTPPADHCDSTWVIAAIKGMDVPRNSSRKVEGCDGTWLVMTLDLNSTQCGAGGRPGCSAPPARHRYFLRFTSGGWRTLLRTTAPGCADVSTVRPDFPTALCRTLPAPG